MDFTVLFIFLLLLLSDSPIPNTGAMKIEANSRNCNEIRVIVIVFIREVCIKTMSYQPNYSTILWHIAHAWSIRRDVE